MASHASAERIEALMERFMQEFPNGDSRELAEFMYDQGVEAGINLAARIRDNEQ